MATSFRQVTSRYDAAGTKTLLTATSSAFGTSVLTRTLCSPGFFSGLARNTEQVLMIEASSQILEIGRKGNGRIEAEEICRPRNSAQSSPLQFSLPQNSASLD
jgi:hypothetical protein